MFFLGFPGFKGGKTKVFCLVGWVSKFFFWFLVGFF